MKMNSKKAMTRAPTEIELRVAKALYAVENHGLTGGWDMEFTTPELREYWLESARAAIRAMRTPTTEMLRDALIGMPVRTEPAAAIWEVLIDAASPQEK